MANFKTSARTLDLLGRQQIAGIPTAINELFKNAHDAYAEFAEIDYFRHNRLFVLRDNGYGMSKEDFETRWLTLGTESKLQTSALPQLPVDNAKPVRQITGEKGIGRLAIASIGKLVLILTKAKYDNNLNKTVVAFINWRIFELPGLSLDDIVIPLREIDGDVLPDENLIENLKEELAGSLRLLLKNKRIPEKEGVMMLREVESFDIIPSIIERSLPNAALSLLKNGHGTHFYISPADEMLWSWDAFLYISCR